jgi:HEAT repeat protein
MEDEALDSRGRNITLAIFGGIVLLIAILVANNYRVKQDRISGMESAVPARQTAKVKELMAGFTNDGFVAEQLQGERPSVRMAAVRSLKLLKDDPNPQTRSDAAKLIVPFLKDSDPPIRDLAAQSLTEMGPDIAMTAATSALGDSDSNVKTGAQAVCESFAPHSIPPLLAFSGANGAKAALRGGRRGFGGNVLADLAKRDERWKTVVLLGEQAVQARARKLTPEQSHAEIKKFMGLDKDLMVAKEDPIYGVVDYLDPLNGNEDDQNNAISILDRIGDVRAVPYLIPKLDSPTTRRAAVGALGRLGDKRATERLVYYLPTDETNRQEIVIALGRIADPASTPPLIQYGLGSVSQAVRAAASDSLRNIGVPAMASLIAAAQANDPQDPAYYKAEGAVRALTGLHNPQATQVAVAALHHVADNVREAAAETLGDSGDPSVIGPLVSSFADKNGRVAGFAARALSGLGEKAVPQLVAALSDPQRVYWSSLAIRYIGMPALPALQQKVLQGDPRGALAAATLLGDLGSDRAIATLKQAIAQRKDPDFQFGASSSLQRLTGGA